ncbi:MAG: LysM peptidoglycan-binding domain-containing protein [Actinomycetia bacterium]|nr:LysM peptidoglycan-binding domain-containing protein [Actinomycetes bacterium]
MGQVLFGFGALLLTVGLLFGIPAALVLLQGSPIPESVPPFEAIVGGLTKPDSGQLLLTTLAYGAWVGWLIFAVSFLAEARAAALGSVQQGLSAIGPRGLARRLVAGIALLALPLSAAATATAEPPVAASHLAPLVVSPSGYETPGKAGDSAADRYVVAAGDTLWGIAEDEWDDGDRYPEIYQASRSVRQEDGRRLTDPDHIEPGWTLVVPTDQESPPTRDRVAPSAQKPTDEPAGGSEARESSDETAGGSSVGQPAENTERASAAKSGADNSRQKRPAAGGASGEVVREEVGGTATLPPLARSESETSYAPAVRASAGIGAILAAGLATGLASIRLRQRRRRHPGSPIALSEPEEPQIVRDITALADPMSVQRVDSALRQLALDLHDASSKLPSIRVAKLYEYQFDLHLAEPKQLPAPWRGNADGTVWSLEQPQEPASDQRREMPSPYPALVTLGHDLSPGRECHVLVDLDHVAALGLFGEPGYVQEVLNALALDLVTSAWADDLQVTALNWLADLDPALRTGRVNFQQAPQPYLAKLVARVSRDSGQMRAKGLSLAEVRTSPTGEYWNPEVVMAPKHLSETDRDQLGSAIATTPRTGVSAITVQDSIGQWYLEQDPQQPDSVTLQPLGIRLEPQRVSDDDYGEILRAFQESQAADSPATQPTLASDEPPLADILSAAAHTPEQERPSTQPELAPRPADIMRDGTAVPHILILGEPAVSGVDGPIEPEKRERCLELAAFLALNPQATPAEFEAAIWPGNTDGTSRAMRSGLLSRTRRWFGTQPNGDFWFEYDHADVCRINSAIRTDWDAFQELLPSGAYAATDQDLRAAMQLVRGRPFAVASSRFGWAAGQQHLMTPHLTDAAFELSVRLLQQCDFTEAAAIAGIGLSVDPWCEPLHRNQLKALAAVDHSAAQTRAHALLADLERFSLEPEAATLDLIGQLQRASEGGGSGHGDVLAVTAPLS